MSRIVLLAAPLDWFGSPATPAFIKATKDRVHERQPKLQRASFMGGDNVITYYDCKYCHGDFSVGSASGFLHAAALTQVDHIVPFSRIRNTNFYDKCTFQVQNSNLDIADIGPMGVSTDPVVWNNYMTQIFYNDLNNLHITCTSHNQSKSNQSDYDAKFGKMSLAYVVNRPDEPDKWS